MFHSWIFLFPLLLNIRNVRMSLSSPLHQVKVYYREGVKVWTNIGESVSVHSCLVTFLGRLCASMVGKRKGSVLDAPSNDRWSWWQQGNELVFWLSVFCCSGGAWAFDMPVLKCSCFFFRKSTKNFVVTLPFLCLCMKSQWKERSGIIPIVLSNARMYTHSQWRSSNVASYQFWRIELASYTLQPFFYVARISNLRQKESLLRALSGPVSFPFF